jgi:hypothetical protein
MDAKSRKELADAMHRTFQIREASWDNGVNQYRLSYHKAADKAKISADIKALVVDMLQSRGADFRWRLRKMGQDAAVELAKDQTRRAARPVTRRR